MDAYDSEPDCLELFFLMTQPYLDNFETLTIYCRSEFRKRTTIMALSINRSTSGFRRWSEAQELKRKGEAGEVAVIPAPQVDQGVMPATEQLHRPWLVPGVGKL